MRVAALRLLLGLGLGLGLAALGGAAATDDPGDVPLRNSVPLPAARAAEAALLAGDGAWRDSGGTGAALRRAFDQWQTALEVSATGDGVRTLIPGGPTGLLPDPDGIADRRAEGVAEAVIRRLAALDAESRRAWIERFTPGAAAALARLGTTDAEEAAALCARVERNFPLTEPALRAALVRVDLALEAGRPVAAAGWLRRAERHRRLGALDGPSLAEALRRRRAAVEAALARPRGFDHSRAGTVVAVGPERAPQPSSQNETQAPKLVPGRTERIIGLTRSASDPLGRGLGSGLAVLRDGTVVVQSALAVLALPGDGGPLQRSRTEELLGIGRASIQATATSGGWTSLPATNGESVALIVGRAERPRAFLDITVPAIGNNLGLVGRGADGELLTARWTLRDGIVIHAPGPVEEDDIDPVRPAPLGTGVEVEGWDLGRGWEFQPGPVMADGAIFALARGLGDPTNDEVSHADEVRLVALEEDGRRVRWTREITRERGTPDDVARGRSSLFAATTMPLALDRASGTLLVGTNVGMIAAYDLADGRLAWSVLRQRSATPDRAWTGSTAPILVPGEGGTTAWLAPLGSDYLYALRVTPRTEDGALIAEAPRASGSAALLGAVIQRPAGVDVALLGRDGRLDALLLDRGAGDAPSRGGTGQVAAAYAGPDDVFTGTMAAAGGYLFAATDTELLAFDPRRDCALVAAAPLSSMGAGRGGNVFTVGRELFVVGRDTVWTFRLE